MRKCLVIALSFTIIAISGWSKNPISKYKAIITVDYCYNILLKDPITGYVTRNSLPYAATYFKSHCSDTSQNVVVVNIGTQANRIYRIANKSEDIFARTDKVVGYDSLQNTPSEIRQIIEGQAIADSIAILRKLPPRDRGSRILVVDIDGSTSNIRSVDITQYYPNRDIIHDLDTIAKDITTFCNKQLFTCNTPCYALDMLYYKGDFATPFHQFQLEKSGADISLFAAADITDTMPKSVTATTILDLIPFDNTLVKVKISGANIDKYLEQNIAGQYNTMNSDNDELLRVELVNGQYRTAKSTHNIDHVAGLNMSINLRRQRGNRVKIIALSNGQQFDRQKTYSVATTSFRAEKMVSEGYITIGDIEPVCGDMIRELVNWLNTTTIIQPRQEVTLEPQQWLEKSYENERKAILATFVYQ